MSKITVNGIWAEDLFSWFESNVASGGGDGAALIICENYKEVATWFVNAWETKHQRKFPHKREEYSHVVNYHDLNENYMFSDYTEHHTMQGDYTFVVVGDCKFAFDDLNSNRTIKAVKIT